MFFRVVVQFFRLFRHVTRGINVTEMEERHDEEIARTLNLKTIFIKLPNQQQKNKMTVSQDTTFGHLKELLSTEHNVEVGRITLVCAGRIMKDEDSVTSQSSLDGMTIHMVVRDLKAKESTMSTNIANVESVDSRPDLAHIEQTVTNSPLLRRPEFLQSALLNDPRIQKLMDSHPSLRHLLSDRRVITNLVRNISNPSVMQEIIRANDRTLNNIESLTGGHAELERVFREFDQSISDLTTQASETASSNAEDVGENPQQGAENREPLPNPWAEVQQTQEGCDLSGVFGRMIGETFTQLVQAQHAYDAEGTTPEATENLQRFIELSQEFSRTLQTNSDVTPEQTYQIQLQHLETMGFSDRNANIAALVAASGDINIAVEKLLEPQGQQD